MNYFELCIIKRHLIKISIMKISKSAHQLKEMIIKAIDDHKITREEYEMIVHHATEDGVVDRQEQILLEQLQDMIANKSVKFVAK